MALERYIFRLKESQMYEHSPSGASVEQPADVEPAALSWTARINLLRSGVLLRQLAFGIGIPILLIMGLLIVLDWPPNEQTLRGALQVGGVLVGIFCVLLAIVLGVVYSGGYAYHYRITPRGIQATTHGRTARTNRIINTLLRGSGHPSFAGAGILAAARQSEFVAWRDVTGFNAHEATRTITLRRGRRALMIVACDAEHYPAVLAYVRSVVQG
jgi:hypothetical protein